MLVTSKDVFWIVLSFVILWIGLCTGWAIFYIAMMLRNLWLVSANIKKKMDFIDQILNTIKNRIENTASYIPPLMEAGSKIIEAINEKKKSDAAKSKKKK